jgi:uncharacterized membrane protein
MELPIPVTVLALIVIVIKGLIDGLLRPLVERYAWSTNVLRVGAWLLGIVFVVLSQVLPEKTFLIVLVALVVGCGSNILQEFLSALGGKAVVSTKVPTENWSSEYIKEGKP